MHEKDKDGEQSERIEKRFNNRKFDLGALLPGPK